MKMTPALAAFLLNAVALSALAQMPGKVTDTVSKLDGERRVEIAPGWLKQEKVFAATPLSTTAPRFGLGGSWSDKAPTNFVLRIVWIAEDKNSRPNLLSALAGENPAPMSAREIEAIGQLPEKLKIGIDGTITDIAPSGTNGTVYAGLGGMRGIERRFEVPLSFVERMLGASNVVVQIGSQQNSTAEGVFKDGTQHARPAFQRALEKIKTPSASEQSKKPAGKTDSLGRKLK